MVNDSVRDHIGSNYIYVQQNIDSLTLPTGIWHEGCIASYIFYDSVYSKKVPIINDRTFGIKVENSIGTKVYCNYVNNVGMGITFKGSSPSTTLAGNYMDTCYAQLYLKNVLAGLGTQGTPTAASENHWGATATYGIYVDTSNTSLSATFFNVDCYACSSRPSVPSYVTPGPYNACGFFYIANPSYYCFNHQNARLINKENTAINLPFGKLFPNPNNGEMQYDYTLLEGSSGEFIIFDISGRKLATYKLSKGYNSLIIDQGNLSNGLYIYKTLVNRQFVDQNKLIIIK